MLRGRRRVGPAAVPAYVVVDIEVHDPDAYQEYARRAPATIEAHGGGHPPPRRAPGRREGDGQRGRLVILEFPDVEAARRWHDSDEYRRLREIRGRASTAR